MCILGQKHKTMYLHFLFYNFGIVDIFAKNIISEENTILEKEIPLIDTAIRK